jgi:hypothetical protein
MGELKGKSSSIVLIGDIVRSKASRDRRRLHRHLEAALADLNARGTTTQALAVTVGDEFQGVFATLGGALDATVRLRLALLPEADVRFGIGRGESQVLDAARGIQDGSAWWAARAAIEDVEARASRAATRLVRTAYRCADDRPDPALPAVMAALDCRDHMVGSLSDRSRRLLGGLMDDATQAELAAREGISASAVSQRVRADGLTILVEAARALEQLP